MSRAAGVIKKMQLVFPKTILLTIYNALILPHLTTVSYHGGQPVQLKLYTRSKKEQLELFPLLVITPTLNRYSNFQCSKGRRYI